MLIMEKSLIEYAENFYKKAKPGQTSESHLLCKLRDWKGWNPPDGEGRTAYIEDLFTKMRAHLMSDIIQGTINYAVRREESQ